MAIAHGLVRTVLGFAAVRFLLGAAEAANFPASIKTVAMWFPQKERALASGIFQLRHQHRRRDLLRGRDAGRGVRLASGPSSASEPSVSSGSSSGSAASTSQRRASTSLLPSSTTSAPTSPRWGPGSRCPGQPCCATRQIWPYLLGQAADGPGVVVLLYWLPSYLSKERGRDPLKSALLIALIYTGASVGSILGGWFSGFLIGRGLARRRRPPTVRCCCPRALHAAHHPGLLTTSFPPVRRPDQPRDRVPPGMVGQHLHDRDGP